jgi:hypothetical protein
MTQDPKSSQSALQDQMVLAMASLHASPLIGHYKAGVPRIELFSVGSSTHSHLVQSQKKGAFGNAERP